MKKILVGVFIGLLAFLSLGDKIVLADGECKAYSASADGAQLNFSASGCLQNVVLFGNVSYGLIISDSNHNAVKSVSLTPVNGDVSYSTTLSSGGVYTVEFYYQNLNNVIYDKNVTIISGVADVQCGKNKDGINTALGCIPFGNANDFISFVLKWALGIAGGVAFLLILFAGFQIMTSRGDPQRLKAGQELLTSAIAGLVLLIFSVFILRLIGFNILGITAFGAK